MMMHKRNILALFALFIVGIFAISAQSSTTYTVKAGDVLDLIALRANVSPTCVANANDLTNPNRLKIGQTLTIPANCPPYDGLSYIPGLMPMTAAVNTDGTDLGQGGGAEASGVTETNAACFSDPVRVRRLGSDDTYFVQRGDILDFIACNFNVDTQCLAKANNLTNPNKLVIGQELTIDRSCPIWVDSSLPASLRPITTSTTTTTNTSTDNTEDTTDESTGDGSNG